MKQSFFSLVLLMSFFQATAMSYDQAGNSTATIKALVLNHNGAGESIDAEVKKHMEALVDAVEKKVVKAPTHDDMCLIWDLQMACAGRYAGINSLLAEFEKDINALASLTETEKKSLKEMIQQYDTAVQKNNAVLDPEDPKVLKTRAALLLYRLPRSFVELKPKK